MSAMLIRMRDFRLARYFVASAAALALDMASFLVLLALGIGAAGAAASGYALGIAAHWMISSRAVFSDGLAARGRPRDRQKALFVGSALIGLALTTAIVGVGDTAGVDPRLGKIVAIGASFIATWLIRSHIVFRTGPAR